MAITTLAGVVAGLRQRIDYHKTNTTTEGAGTFLSFWKIAGRPVPGASPPAYNSGSGYSMDKDTVGAIPFVNPASGNTYLAEVVSALSTIGTLIIYDRLWACSGLTTNSATTLNITTPGTIPSRDANGAALGAGVELWLEVYGAPGATAATWSVAYTDQDGNSGTATYDHPANAEAVGQIIPMALADGDTGVRAVSSITFSGASGADGNIGITLLRRIVELPNGGMSSGFGIHSSGPAGLALPRIYDSSCLAVLINAYSSSTGLETISLSFAQG